MGVPLDEKWRQFATGLAEADDWVSRGLLPIVRLAHADAVLRRLDPFQSMSRLCFGRGEGRPEADWPCIEVVQDGRFFVFDRTYEREGSKGVALAETRSAEEAIDVLKQHLSTPHG